MDVIDRVPGLGRARPATCARRWSTAGSGARAWTREHGEDDPDDARLDLAGLSARSSSSTRARRASSARSSTAGAARSRVDGSVPADAVGHRVVHGGQRFREPVLIDAAVERRSRSSSRSRPSTTGHVRDAIRQRRPRLPDRVERGPVVERRERDQLPSAASTSSSRSTGSRKRGPPWTTRWPTASAGTNPSTRSDRSCVVDERELEARRARVDDGAARTARSSRPLPDRRRRAPSSTSAP